MAAIAKAAPPPELEQVDAVYSVPIAEIEVGERVRPIKPQWARELGQVMEVEGQKDPISICRLPGRPGFKLVKGKGGRRHWTDEAAAADALKKARLKVDQIYTRKVISPTDAEKLHKAGAIKTRLYKAIEALAARPEGGPTLAPITDPRPAYSLTAAPGDFDDVSNII